MACPDLISLVLKREILYPFTTAHWGRGGPGRLIGSGIAVRRSTSSIAACQNHSPFFCLATDARVKAAPVQVTLGKEAALWQLDERNICRPPGAHYAP